MSLGLEPVARRLELGPQPQEVVDLAVEGDDDGAVLVLHRLGALGDVDDRQSPVPEGHLPVTSGPYPRPLAVRAAVRNAAEHAAERGGIRPALDEPRDAAHWRFRVLSWLTCLVSASTALRSSRYKSPVTDRPQVSIVIPCYNEEQTVPRLCAALDDAVAKLVAGGRQTEVLIVDDGSKDESFARLKAAAATRPWMRLIRFRRNFGQTAAMAAGFDLGARRVRRADGRRSAERSRRTSRGCWRTSTRDTTSSPAGGRTARTLHAASCRRMIANWLIWPRDGRPAARLRLHAEGLPPRGARARAPLRRDAPVHPDLRQVGRGARHRAGGPPSPAHGGQVQVRPGRTLKVVLDLMTVKFLGDYSTKPLYLFGLWGILFILGGIASGIVTLVEKFMYANHYAHRNPLLLLAVMLFVVGIQLIGMGLLAELLVRTYHEAQAKPVYLIAEEINAPAPGALGARAVVPFPVEGKRPG